VGKESRDKEGREKVHCNKEGVTSKKLRGARRRRIEVE
jgi:hypothetical protein